MTCLHWQISAKTHRWQTENNLSERQQQKIKSFYEQFNFIRFSSCWTRCRNWDSPEEEDHSSWSKHKQELHLDIFEFPKVPVTWDIYSKPAEVYVQRWFSSLQVRFILGKTLHHTHTPACNYDLKHAFDEGYLGNCRLMMCCSAGHTRCIKVLIINLKSSRLWINICLWSEYFSSMMETVWVCF